jgi:aminocarboxymuconate-semialdehyde decarboxylase
MPTIDIHTHIIPDQQPDWAQKFGYPGFIRLDHHKPCCARMMKGDQFFREIEENCWNPEARINDCRHTHVDIQVLSVIPVTFYYWAKPQDTLAVSRFQNEYIAKTVDRYPGHFIGLGTVPLQDPALAAKECENIRKMGLKGIEIGSHINDMNLDDKRLFEFYDACIENDLALFVHPWDMMGQERMKKYWLPWLVGMPAETSLAICSMIFGGIFDKFPKLRVAFAHGGGSFPATIGRIEHGHKVRPDLVAIDNPNNPRNYIGRFWIDSLVHDITILKYLINLMGAEKIALGSDYPFPLGEHVPGKMIKESDLDNETKEWLLWKSATQWLNLDTNQFLQ